jgi:hypothetical protein
MYSFTYTVDLPAPVTVCKPSQFHLCLCVKEKQALETKDKLVIHSCAKKRGVDKIACTLALGRLQFPLLLCYFLLVRSW